MSVEIRFLGWDAPATTKVREFLIPGPPSKAVDLGRELVVVPTNQAGRRLREALAAYCASHKTALLSPWVVEPTYFLQPGEGAATIAGPLETIAVWVEVLLRTDLNRYRGLFPTGVPSPDFTWALHTAGLIQNLRKDLADGGYLISHIVRDRSNLLEELERWRDVAALETAYLERLASLRLTDKYRSMIQSAENPEVSRGVERIIVAAVPDPTPLTVRALERLAARMPVIVMVHAPQSLADHFDGWGRPLAAAWAESRIAVPDAGANIILSGSPWAQSARAVELIAAEAERFGPADIAIGVPDGQVTPFLAADLVRKGLVPFDPAGRSISQHPLYLLLDAFRELVSEASYQAFSTAVRNADLLDLLAGEHRLSAYRLLEELDNFQNNRLPQTLDDIEQGLLPRAGPEARPESPNLSRAAGFLLDQVSEFERADLDTALRGFLQEVYEKRTVNPRRPDDADFITVAESIDDALRRLKSDAVLALGLDKRQALELLLSSLGSQTYNPEPQEGAVIDLEGWLELPWNDAPFLIVTGMNDGSVPATRLDDVFLPDSLRWKLALRHDADRLARDAYLMNTLIESRRERGRVCFIAGKTGGTGDVLKPSRLLFLCSDEELPQRAERLFGSPAETRANVPSSISFRLEVTPPRDVGAGKLTLASIQVTAFSQYLACPFRFYLKRILGMEELDDLKPELDAMDFGSLVHDVLQAMAQDEAMRCCREAGQLADFLCASADDWVARRLGRHPPLQVEVQLESARQRLREAARVQARLVRQGWEILACERPIQDEIEGMVIRGKIDRIDRHREDGRIRLLDYKTSEQPQTPEEAHISSLPRDREIAEHATLTLNGVQRRWTDLQLPLYAILLSSEPDFPGRCELGYFNLPKALPDTGPVIWESFAAHLLQSARACAAGVIRDIRSRTFWPPAPRVRYDDFEGLFPGDVSDCVNGEAFQAYLKGDAA
ncbi:MAG: hypothetical protein FJ020_03320 [Chloroflexi bacterium]|nr:hypothetical protein [Chloroflexota bacterium]